MSSVSKFDETNAIIRLLLVLRDNEGVNHTILQELMAPTGAKRGSMDTAIKNALILNLIVVKSERVGTSPRASSLHYLTEKGRLIAEKLDMIRELLDG